MQKNNFIKLIAMQRLHNLSLVLFTCLMLNDLLVCSQNGTVDAKESYCKFSVFSKNRENQPLDVFYYNAKNKIIRSTGGFNRVNACQRILDDTVRTVSVWATDYFLRILKFDYPLTNKIDTLFLTRLSNDSLSKIEGLIFNGGGNIDLYKSKIALEAYTKYITQQLRFRFNILVNNSEALKKAETFFKEVTKNNAALKNKLTIEITSNTKLLNGIYLKALRQKK
jgi:hypothetical protein